VRRPRPTGLPQSSHVSLAPCWKFSFVWATRRLYVSSVFGGVVRLTSDGRETVFSGGALGSASGVTSGRCVATRPEEVSHGP
jgi:hypothetical protein